MSDTKTASGSLAGLPYFDGSKDKYMVWQLQFEAYGMMKEFAPALKKLEYLPDDLMVDESADEKVKKKQQLAIEMNAAAYRVLTLAMKFSAGVTILKSANKKAYVVMEKLEMKFAGKEVETQITLLDKLARMQMPETMSPEAWFDKVDGLKDSANASGYSLHDSTVLQTLLQVAPSSYRSVIATSIATSSDRTEIDLEGIKNAMETEFKIQKLTAGKLNDKDDKEIAMNASPSSTQAMTKCDHCGSGRHKSSKCWKKYPERAPKWWKQKQEWEQESDSNDDAEQANVQVEYILGVAQQWSDTDGNEIITQVA
jgi:hypothetical protein